MRFLNRVPIRLSLIFLALIAAMAVALSLLTLGTFEQRQVEIDQRLNRDLAASMAGEIEMIFSDQGPDAEIGEAIHYMMVLNPAVEIYLLDSNGVILGFFASPGAPVQSQRVPTEPLDRFVSGTERLPIYAEDPRRPGELRHFSAARISLPGGSDGYLYVVLRSTGYDQASMMLQRDYLWLALRNSLLITVPVVALLGLLLFFSETRRLMNLATTVQAFGDGDLERRSDIRSGDEIGELSERFNSMANTIVSQMRAQQEIDRSRRELMANISHDLRNPLASIQGYIETLSDKDGALEEGQRRRYLEILSGSTDVLRRLVDDIFELSKLESPDLQPEMEEFSLAELVHDVVLQLTQRADAAGVDLSAERPSGLHMALGNVGMMERVLINLIDNAIRHTPAGGRITVTIESRLAEDGTSPASVVHVADTGSGVPAEDLPHIFDRFYIGDKSRTAARKGSGLGLAICRRIVELHGGVISARSEPGSGTTVSFPVPSVSV